MWCPVCASKLSYARAFPSGDQDNGIGRLVPMLGDSRTGCSSPLPSASFQKIPCTPATLPAKVTRLLSADQVGMTLLDSNVRRFQVLREMSFTQISSLASATTVAICVPSGEIRGAQ